jgi:hypothetical protein
VTWEGRGQQVISHLKGDSRTEVRERIEALGQRLERTQGEEEVSNKKKTDKFDITATVCLLSDWGAV